MNNTETNETFDVVFESENSSNSKGFKCNYDYCYEYIQVNNGTNNSYFADYKNGIVSIICNETGESLYSEIIK